MGFLSDEEQSYFKEPITWKEATQKVLNSTSTSENDLTWAISSKTKFKDNEEKERILAGLKWIGLFSDEKVSIFISFSTMFETLATRTKIQIYTEYDACNKFHGWSTLADKGIEDHPKRKPARYSMRHSREEDAIR